VLIADDQILFAESLKYVLERASKSVHVVGIAEDGSQAIEMARRLKPDVVLMDVRMPGVDGVTATRTILREHGGSRVVMLTTFDDDEYVHEAIRCGASGYLLKNMRPRQLINDIQAVMGGATLFSEQVRDKLFEERPVADKAAVESLTRRECEILKLLVAAMGNKRIAEKLCISEQVVRNYVSAIYAKLGVEDRMELIQRYRGPPDRFEKAL
jgi:DNA-binding NarL/FixJ family response regulator